MCSVTANPVKSLRHALDSVIEDHEKFIRACRWALIVQTTLFVAIFVLIWVRT
jgi:hypothetical protein